MRLELKKLKIEIFNCEICVCALLDTNLGYGQKMRRNGGKIEK